MVNRIGTEAPTQLPARRDAFSLRDVVFVLFRRRWIILAICVPIILVGGVSLFRQTGSFTATSRVVVELTKVGLPQWNTTGRNIDYDRELSTLFNIAMSVSIAEKAADGPGRLGARRSIRLDNKVRGFPQPTDLRDYLLEGLAVNVVGESNILEFQFSSPNPRISLMAVGALRDAFIEYQDHGRRNPGAIVYYQEQMRAVRSDIDSLLEERGDVVSAAGYTSLEEELKHEVGQQAELENKLMQTQVELRALRIEHGMLQEYIDRDPREFPMGRDQSTSHPLVYWRNTVAKREDELNAILAIHTPESAACRRQQAILDAAVERPAPGVRDLRAQPGGGHRVTGRTGSLAQGSDLGDPDAQQPGARRVPARFAAGHGDQRPARPARRPAGQVGRGPHDRTGRRARQLGRRAHRAGARDAALGRQDDGLLRHHRRSSPSRSAWSPASSSKGWTTGSTRPRTSRRSCGCRSMPA